MTVIFDYVHNGFNSEFLSIASIIAILFAISVITIKNPISSLLSLIGLFGCVSVYLIFIGLNFIGFSYLIVYIGAVSILFLFILMLINIRTSELLSNNINSIPLALLVIILLNYTWLGISPESIGILNNGVDSIGSTLSIFSDIGINLWDSISNNSDVMFTTSNNWDGSIAETGHIASIGMIIYTVYNIWLLLASLILLLAMVGCIAITIKKKGD